MKILQDYIHTFWHHFLNIAKSSYENGYV